MWFLSLHNSGRVGTRFHSSLCRPDSPWNLGNLMPQLSECCDYRCEPAHLIYICFKIYYLFCVCVCTCASQQTTANSWFSFHHVAPDIISRPGHQVWCKCLYLLNHLAGPSFCWDRNSYSSGWSQTQYVAKNDCFYVPPHPIYAIQGIKPRALGMQSKHSTTN